MTGLVIVALQSDFTELEAGALAVPGTDQAYLDRVGRYLARHQGKIPVFASQDWHPADHVSFASNNPGARVMEVREGQVMWPDHCVQGSPGARLLIPTQGVKVVRKGMDRRFDSYSAFKDDGGAETGLERMLRQAGVKRIMTFGLATDYCVRYTVLDALSLGFEVKVLIDLCRGVDPETTAQALAEMEEQGAEMGSSKG